MGTPRISDLHTYLRSDHVFALSRVLHEIAEELERRVNRDGEQPPIRFVFSGEEADRLQEDCITVTPVPVRFNRDGNAWSLACVLDWNAAVDGIDVSAKTPVTAGPHHISDPAHRLSSEVIGARDLLAGILFHVLESRTLPSQGFASLLLPAQNQASNDLEHLKHLWLKAIAFEDLEKPIEFPISASHDTVQQQIPQAIAVDDQDLSWHVLAEKLYLSELRKIDPTASANSIVVPVYDQRPFGDHYGSLLACIILTIGRRPNLELSGANAIQHQQQYREALVSVTNRVVRRLGRYTELLVVELEKAALTTVAAEVPHAPYDLVEHFVRVLRHVQYWESVTVYKSGRRLYRYAWTTRTTDSGQPRHAWTRSLDLDSCDPGPRTWRFVCPWNAAAHDHSALDWCEGEWFDLCHEDLWSNAQQREEIRNAFDDIAIEFEFSRTAVIPQDEKILRSFYRGLIQQQIEVIRAVLPVVRARRAALRSAVSAIMGRNMSHNIGSHVLARYSSVIQTDLDPTSKVGCGRDVTDHRTEFLVYLQRRMDFLAEIATSDRSHWSQSLSLKECLSTLNYKEQLQRILPPGATASADGKNRPILLSFITGKQSICASVTLLGNQDVWFSCPSGEVGVHALYIILENVIRNSARHNDARPQDNLLRIDVTANCMPDSGKIEVTVIDHYSRILDQEDNLGRLPLHSRINLILKNEPFLEDDGTPNAGYWGLREMQIAASYLRGFSLSELETAPATTVLEALRYDVGDGTGCLAYRFFLDPARLLAVVGGEPATYQNWNSPDRRTIYIPVDTFPINWKDLGAKTKGYDFAVLCDQAVVKAYEAASIEDQLLMPVRTIPVSNEALNQLMVQKAVTLDTMSNDRSSRTVDNATGWMAALHQEIADLYSENGPEKAARWGSRRNAVVVLAPQGGSKAAHQRQFGKIILANTALNPSSGTDYYPFSWLPQTLFFEEAKGVPDDGVMGFGLLDHGNDANLLQHSRDVDRSGCTADASFHLGRLEPATRRNWVTVEPMWSGCVHGRLKDDDVSAAFISEYVAAALARVVLLDERIQSRRLETVRGVQLMGYWPQVGIWSPLRNQDDTKRPYHDVERVCDLDRPDFGALRRFLSAPTKLRHQLPADFLVLHLTILEALNKQRNEASARAPGVEHETLGQTLKALIDHTAVERACIVLVTGRGVPATHTPHVGSDIPNARFMPVSALMESLVLRPSKMALMRTLWSASAPNPTTISR